MKLNFDLELEDVIAFHRHYFRNAPHMQRRVAMARWVFPFIFVIFGVNFLSRGFTATGLAIAGVLLLAAVLWIVLVRRIMEKSFLGRAEKMFLRSEEGGPCEMEITGDRLQCSMDGILSGFSWENVVSVYETSGYIFIYRTDTEAFILPKKKIGKSELEEFRKIVPATSVKRVRK